MPHSKRPSAGDYCYDLIIICLLACISAYSIFAARFGIPDDAFIYLRIADNLASGYGWSFNPGIVTDAATSPFFVVVLAILKILGITGKAALLTAYWAGLASLLLIIYLQLKGAGRIASALAAIAILLLSRILNPIGMETSVFLASVALVCTAYERDWKLLAGLALGIAILGRPEAIVMLPIIVGFDLVIKKSLPWTSMSACFLVIVPWLLYSKVELHGFIPHTVVIKSIQSHVAWWIRPGGWSYAFMSQLPLPYLATPCFFIGCLILISDIRSRPRFATLFVGFGLAQAFFYSVLHAPVGYFWYFVPANVSYLMAAFIGASFLIRKFQERIILTGFNLFPPAFENLRMLNERTLGLVLSIACVFGLKILDTSKPYRRSDDYVAAAGWLRTHGSRKDWVAADEVGYIGYFSDLNVKDMLGLLEQNSTQYLRNDQWDWWYAEQTTRPKFVVLHEPNWIGEPNAPHYEWPIEKRTEFFNIYAKVQSFGKVAIYELAENAVASDKAFQPANRSKP